MALTYNQLSAITEKKFIPKAVDNIFSSNALLQRQLKKNLLKLDGGDSIIQPVIYAKTSAGGWYSGYDTLDTDDNEQITAAELQWKQAYANISISRLEELKNSGDSAKINLVKTKVQIAEKTLKDTLGTGLYSAGTTAKSISGLRVIVTGTGTTYAGISKTTYSWWRGQVDSTTTTLLITVMQGIWGDCSIDSDRPTVVVGTQDNYDRYYALLQPQQRFMDSETAKGGFSNLLFNGVPFIVDSHCPTGYIYFLNENYLNLTVHQDENFRFEPFQKPTRQNAATAKIYWAGNFMCSNCRMQGVLSAITA
ncbi:MAG TPA: phage major capsid protein [Candidatus Omnitrophota bacterium]|nr:phage major capsid protein [Candidatus Omnitrophota bacterium]